MPYVAPSTVSAGQTYASASHNIIVNDIIDHESRLLTVQNTQYPYRNVLINGAMQIAQRGTSVSGIANTSAYNTVDRWIMTSLSSGTWTQAVSADAPTGSGFRNSVRITCATAITSLTAGAQGNIVQRLEGQTLQHIKKGTSSAQQLTLSFWVKGSTTGTYIAELYDFDNTRSVSSAYAINSANTWEQKVITFPADTTGAFDNDNAASLQLMLWFAAGSNATSGTLNTSWNNHVGANEAVGQTNLAAAVNNYLAVTGVQLEPGAVASPYEFVLYQDELRRCQRYYVRLVDTTTSNGEVGNGFMYTTTSATISIPLPVEMRAVPNPDSSNLSNLTLVDSGLGSGTLTAVANSNQGTRRVLSINVTTGTVLTAARAAVLRQNSTAGMVAATAEL